MQVLINGVTAWGAQRTYKKKMEKLVQRQTVSLKHTTKLRFAQRQNQYAELYCTLAMQVNYCSQEQLVYGIQQNAEYPRETLGLVSVNTGRQLEQKVELQS